MLLHFIFLFHTIVFSACLDTINSLSNSTKGDASDLRHQLLSMKPVEAKSKKKVSPCEQYAETSLSPYIVMLLYKTAGRFMGLGSIIDKRSVLTSKTIVENVMDYPPNMLVLAGRLTAYWGPGSQVTPAKEIYYVDTGIAIISVRRDFIFTKTIKPIQIAFTDQNTFHADYGGAFATYGVKRTGWDSPGDYLSKAYIYGMAIEINPLAQVACKDSYPDVKFEEDKMMCTYWNGSWSWGCLGAPAIGVNKQDEKFLVGVLFKAASNDKENYHFYTRIMQFEHWIKAHSLLAYV